MKKFIPVAAILLVVILAWPFVSHQIQFNKLQSEIDRVISDSSYDPIIECRDVSFAAICYAEFESANAKKLTDLLTNAGYSLEDNGSGISATNTSTNVRVDTEPNYTDSNAITLKFKDINVTL